MNAPDWKAERYLLGELPESEMAALKTLEKESDAFRASLCELRGSNEELLAKYPAKAAAEKMLAGARRFSVIEPARNRWLIPLSACAALLLCSAALLAALSGEFGGEKEPQQLALAMNEESGERVKGLKAGLEIWRKAGDSAEKLSDNSLAAAGDLLQIRYAVPEQCYGALLSLDGNGVLTVHLSGEQGRAARLEAGRMVSLENAYELDDARKFETFYLFTGGEEFAVASVAESLLSGKLPKGLPKGLKISQITLRKR